MAESVHYNETITNFVIGAVVRVMSDTHYGMLGHVKGFSMNCYNEITVKVSLCNFVDAEYHHCHLEVMK